ncbi:MAG: DUF1616 domain-containing protein [Halobacteriales archaeon]|nr:DUF1616 domain-containing protein [Halobacteriales archaeon]
MNALAAAWMAVGTLLVLLGPGWAWSLALFPRSRPLRVAQTGPDELDAVERAGLALVLSLVLVPLGAIAWSGLLRLPLSTLGATLYLVVLTGLGLAVHRWAPRLLAPGADAGPDDLSPGTR